MKEVPQKIYIYIHLNKLYSYRKLKITCQFLVINKTHQWFLGIRGEGGRDDKEVHGNIWNNRNVLYFCFMNISMVHFKYVKLIICKIYPRKVVKRKVYGTELSKWSMKWKANWAVRYIEIQWNPSLFQVSPLLPGEARE